MKRFYRPIRRHLGDVGLFSAADIQTFAANAGFSGPDLAIAVAIALAESLPSGNPNSYNPETQAAGGTPQGQGSYGLWQIYLKKHPEFAGQNLMDPQTNANAAYSIYSRRGGFSDWSTYTSGAYLQYLSSVPAATPAPLTIDASTGQVINDSTPTATLTVDQYNALSNPPSTAPSPGVIVGAIALGIGALVLEELLL